MVTVVRTTLFKTIGREKMEDDELLTTRQIADELGVSDSLIRKLVGQGKITPVKRIANIMLFKKEDMERLRTRKRTPGPEAKKQ